jgi:hypothetical protein
VYVSQLLTQLYSIYTLTTPIYYNTIYVICLIVRTRLSLGSRKPNTSLRQRTLHNTVAGVVVVVVVLVVGVVAAVVGVMVGVVVEVAVGATGAAAVGEAVGVAVISHLKRE